MFKLKKNELLKVTVVAVSILMLVTSSVLIGVKVSNAARLNPDGSSFYDNYAIKKVSDEALFRLDGTINGNVLFELRQILDSVEGRDKISGVSRWADDLSSSNSSIYVGDDYHETNALDFSNYAKGSKAAGAVNIKLFENVPGTNSANNGYLPAFSNKWFQLVYRATDNDADILTLWMTEQYRPSRFNNNGGRTYGDDFGNKSYAPDANYSQSIVRTNVLNAYDNLISKFSQVDQYIARPQDLPGQWQSSEFQMDVNANGNYFKSGDAKVSSLPEDGLGAFGWTNDKNSNYSADFYINNGLDGESAGFSTIDTWPGSQVVSCFTDKLWLPSLFENQMMGPKKGMSNASLSTANYHEKNITPNASRMGLWRTSAFDNAQEYNIAEGGSVWLRNGGSVLSVNASYQSYSGSFGTSDVASSGRYVRPGIHLDLNAFPETTAVTYNPGEGTGTVKPDHKIIGEPLKLSTAKFKRDGFAQTGWALTQGGAKEFSLGGIYNVDADIELFPYWDVAHVVSYNTGIGNVRGEIENDFKINGITLVLSNSTFKRTGFEQTGWKNSNGTKIFSLGGDYYDEEDIVLYPIWAVNNTVYTITYEKGETENVSGNIEDSTKLHGEEIKLSLKVFIKRGFKQIGWITDDDDEEVQKQFKLGDFYSDDDDLILYPIWETTGLSLKEDSDNNKIYVDVADMEDFTYVWRKFAPIRSKYQWIALDETTSEISFLTEKNTVIYECTLYDVSGDYVTSLTHTIDGTNEKENPRDNVFMALLILLVISLVIIATFILLKISKIVKNGGGAATKAKEDLSVAPPA